MNLIVNQHDDNGLFIVGDCSSRNSFLTGHHAIVMREVEILGLHYVAFCYDKIIAVCPESIVHCKLFTSRYVSGLPDHNILDLTES